MADLSFAYDAGMQDGKGDNEYMDFTHKYMFAVGVRLTLLCQLSHTNPNPGNRRPAPTMSTPTAAPRDPRRNRLQTTR
jgi:hypothetical protein